MYDGLDTYYYFWANGSIMAEYLDRGSPGPRWTKSYFYAGSRLIFTTSRVNSTTEKKETHHPDRLGTKIVTNVDSGAAFEQSTLPFGTAFGAESSGYSNQVFTSYDRSSTTGLDYANNRTYSSGQGRFTQVDPLGMSAASIGNPQSNNMYAYVQNMPTDFVDPSGLRVASPENGFNWLNQGYGIFTSLMGSMWFQMDAWTDVGFTIPINPDGSLGEFHISGLTVRGSSGGSIWLSGSSLSSIGSDAADSGGGGGDLFVMGPRQTDRRHGLPNAFWNWYHKCRKQPGDPDLSREEALEEAKEWKKSGSPNVRKGDDCNGPRGRGPGSEPVFVPLRPPTVGPVPGLIPSRLSPTLLIVPVPPEVLDRLMRCPFGICQSGPIGT